MATKQCEQAEGRGQRAEGREAAKVRTTRVDELALERAQEVEVGGEASVAPVVDEQHVRAERGRRHAVRVTALRLAAATVAAVVAASRLTRARARAPTWTWTWSWTHTTM